jgi:hypothetical protein
VVFLEFFYVALASLLRLDVFSFYLIRNYPLIILNIRREEVYNVARYKNDNLIVNVACFSLAFHFFARNSIRYPPSGAVELIAHEKGPLYGGA